MNKSVLKVKVLRENVKMPKRGSELASGFDVRAYNCLKRANILTLRDLTEKSENEMMKIRNLGKKSLKEVMDKVKDMGLSFKSED